MLMDNPLTPFIIRLFAVFSLPPSPFVGFIRDAQIAYTRVEKKLLIALRKLYVCVGHLSHDNSASKWLIKQIASCPNRLEGKLNHVCQYSIAGLSVPRLWEAFGCPAPRRFNGCGGDHLLESPMPAANRYPLLDHCASLTDSELEAYREMNRAQAEAV